MRYGCASKVDFSPIEQFFLHEDVLHHIPVHIGETVIAAAMPVGEAGMIDAEQMEYRRVKIVHVHFVLYNGGRDVVGRHDALESLFISASEEVASELLTDKLTVGKISIEGRDDPIAILVHLRDGEI